MLLHRLRRHSWHPLLRWAGPPMLAVALLAGWMLFQGLGARADLDRATTLLTEAQDLSRSGDVDTAAARAAAAADAAASADGRLNGFAFDLLRPVPWAGRQVGAAQALAGVAADLSRDGSAVLTEVAASPLSDEGSTDRVGVNDLVALDRQLGPILPSVQRTSATLAAATGTVHRLQGLSLIGPLRRVLDELDPKLSALGRQLGAVESAALIVDRGARSGPPLRLLFLAQDSWELRPSGGFIGSYGILEIGRGRLHMATYRDATDLPFPRTAIFPPEPLRSNLPEPWNLTGAGWWPDFPTSARAAQQMVELSTGEKVDGVLGSTQQFLEDLLAAIGGRITVRGYPDVLTPETVSDRILYHVELKRPLDQPRKRFLTLLTEELFDRLETIQGKQSRDALSALGRAFKLRHLQLYLDDPADQAVLERADWTGSLTAPDRGDLFTLADANFGTDKANRWVHKDTTYTVTRLPSGRLVARVDVRTEDIGEQTSINPAYSSYLRIYAPPGAELVDAAHHTHDVRTDTENGLVTFGAGQTIRPQSAKTRRFVYYLPDSVLDGDSYRLFLRPQAGTPGDTITVRLDLGGPVITRRFTSEDGDQVLTARVGGDVEDVSRPDGPWTVEPPVVITDRCTLTVPKPLAIPANATPQERTRAMREQQEDLQARQDRLLSSGCEQVRLVYR
ncbi:hypothetical protein GCM10022215_18570 [Nocardioides fonticola]|uniref:DUF4012 domain-containing protein n=1 Tax=Nocardioides fonticola TaxID=450363 RepID=A0ABP7XHZ7_9ACTN